ncbi:hypothetical protein BDW22DRAFT_1430436 [Trametopsis cervina]|nr:hypothetical protein BDW22DRAFT_1430436 [Trametopsis cervina]
MLRKIIRLRRIFVEFGKAWRSNSAGRVVSSVEIWAISQKIVPRTNVSATIAASRVMNPQLARSLVLLPPSNATLAEE